MRIILAIATCLIWSMSIGAQDVDLEFMNYENLMVGKTPIHVDIPTEKIREPQSIVDIKRSPGKNVQRAPAIENFRFEQRVEKTEYK